MIKKKITDWFTRLLANFKRRESVAEMAPARPRPGRPAKKARKPKSDK